MNEPFTIELEAVPLMRQDNQRPVGRDMIVRQDGYVLGVAVKNQYLLHDQVGELFGYALTDHSLVSSSRIVGWWGDGLWSITESVLDLPSLPGQRVQCAFWLINNCIDGTLLVHPGVQAVFGADDADSVFVLYPNHTIKINRHYGSEMTLIAKGVETLWSGTLLPWLRMLMNLETAPTLVHSLQSSLRHRTSVSAKYLNMADVDFAQNGGGTSWHYMRSLSTVIDQMVVNVHRRLDLRQRANKPVRVILDGRNQTNEEGM